MLVFPYMASDMAILVNVYGLDSPRAVFDYLDIVAFIFNVFNAKRSHFFCFIVFHAVKCVGFLATVTVVAYKKGGFISGVFHVEMSESGVAR